jgi:hypothetical protein
MTVEASAPTTDTSASPASEAPAAPAAYGPAAIDRIVSAHRAAVEAKKAPAKSEDDEDEDDDETPAAPPAAQPQGKKRTIGAKMKELRQQRAALRQQLADLQAKLQAPQTSPSFDPEGFKKSPLKALEQLGLDRTEALDLIQKDALETGGLPPAVAKALDRIQSDLQQALKRNEELEKRLAEREETERHEAGVRALKTEAADLKKYPELEGYEWPDLEGAIYQAIEFLRASGKGSATAQEVLGLVNVAFGQHHAKIAARASKKAPAPPAPPAPEPARKGKAAPPPLPPVTPGPKGKVRLPTRQEIQLRVERASAR